METYVMLTKLTVTQGRKTLKQNPNRTKEVNKEIEGMGGRIVGQYAVVWDRTTTSTWSRRPTTRPSRRSRWSSDRAGRWRS